MRAKDHKIVIVTGATSGVGAALIPALQSADYLPVLTGRDAGKVADLSQKLGVPGYALDVGDARTVRNVSARIEAEQGPVWGLVNNAGIWLEGDFIEHDASDIKAVMDINCMGTMLMTHALLPGMASRGAGAIVNVVSTGALYSRKMISVYSASKWAIRGFTGCLEVEYAPRGVRVMGFYPGKIASKMYEKAGIDRDLEVAMTPDQAASMIVTMLRDETMLWSHVSGRSIRDYT